MVNEEKLSVVLSEFARTVITDFPIQAILDHLVTKIVDLMPVSGAGVSLIGADNKSRYIAASDASALLFEQVQSDLGEGPCLAAYASAAAVSVPDLAADERFPRFAPAALDAGLAAVFTFPLGRGAASLGALDLYKNSPGALDQQDMEAAQTLADVATAYLLNAQARDAATAASDAFLHNSLHDPLTGLPNRLLLSERLTQASELAKRRHSRAAVLFVDLDRFKDVNDRFGHHVGDAVLLAVTERLRNVVRVGDTLARVSGDEFVIFCDDIAAPADAEMLAGRICERLRAPLVIMGRTIVITASVGISYTGPGQEITTQLIIDADMAMYKVKSRGGGGHDVVDVRDPDRPNLNDQLEEDLRAAVRTNQLHVEYQPIVHTRNQHVAGVEALVRWAHPTLGDVEPRTIIAVAERSQLINEIGDWVLRRACQEHKRWLDTRPGITLDLSVNVSVRQLLQPRFAATVIDALVANRTDPTDLILEVTENIFIDDDARVAAVLEELHGFGVRIALDDYGTGFSSLHYLAHLPIHVLKIDRCFITDLTKPANRIIVASVNSLAHDLGLGVIAEGVETDEQHHIIEAIGCDQAQGYRYARPMSAAAFDDFLA